MNLLARAKTRNDVISKHLAKEESKYSGNELNELKGIIWVETGDLNQTHLSQLVSNNPNISQIDTNPNCTKYEYASKDSNQTYQIIFINNPLRVNKYVKDFGLKCHLVVNVVNSVDDKQSLIKLVQMQKLLKSKFAIILRSSSDNSGDDEKTEFMSQDDCKDTFETAYTAKHPNCGNLNNFYQMYSHSDDLKQLFSSLLQQCHS